MMNFEKNSYISGFIPSINYRFVIGDITETVREIGALQNASPQSEALLGQVILGCFFLAVNNLKQGTRTVSLHLECRGPSERIIGFAGSGGGVRGHTAHPDASWPGRLSDGKKDGIMRVNLWKEREGRVYSSAVEMHDFDFEKNLEEYCGKSDQIQTFVKFSGKGKQGNRTAGYMFQALPGASFEDTDSMLKILEGHEPEDLLTEEDQSGGIRKTGRLSVRYDSEILSSGRFYFHCTCSEEKIRTVAASLGRDELNDLLEKENRVEILCEFCKKKYVLSRDEVEKILGETMR